MVFIKNLVPLSLLYCFEGILLGLILHSIPKELLDSGIDIGIYKFRFLILIPYMLRYIVAPLLDSLSWEKGGRRRSQLCVLYFLLGVLLFFSNLQSLDQCFWKLFWIICVLACIDLLIASWLVESLQKDDRGYAALAQFLGVLSGGFIGAYIFQMFNSLDFCNLYIYAIPQETPYITIQIAFRDLAYISFGISAACVIIIHNETSQNQDIMEAYKSALYAFSNRHLIVYFLFFCFFRIGQMPIDLAHIHMKRKSFTEGQIQFLEILTFPIACFIPYYMSKMIKNRTLEIRLIIVFTIYEIIISGLFIICLFATEEELPFPYRDILLKISLIAVWILNFMNITFAYSFIYKSTKSTISATFISLLSNVLVNIATGINFQFMFEGVVEYFLANYNYYLIWMIGVGVYALFFFHIASRATQIDQLDCQEFCLDIDIKKEKLLVQTELTALS